MPNPAEVIPVSLKLAGTSVEALLFAWYARQLYIKIPSLLQKDRDDMNVLAKMICYAKLFMPVDTILDCKPPPTSKDECSKWDAGMQQLGKVVQRNVMAFISKHTTESHRSKKSFVQGVMKHLQKIPSSEYPMVSIVDRTAIGMSRSNMWYFSSISEFK